MDRTPTYRIEFRSDAVMTNQAWYRDYGRPTDANLARFVKGLVESTKPGGVNSHLGQLYITAAQVVRQATGEIVAVYYASLFEVVEVA